MVAVYSIAVLVLLFVGFHLVAGWIYATRFHKTALLPQPASREYGVWVRRATSHEIVLTATEPRQDIGHPGTVGVHWEGGYGQTGEVQHVEGLEVTRGFKVLRGEGPPICEGVLSDCEQVDLESYAFPSDPADVGLDFETVAYESPLGPMSGWLVPATGSTTWAVHVHGWTAHRRETIRLLTTIHSKGISSLAIDYRNDPGSPVDPSGHYRFGLSEWEDVEAAVRFALDHGAEDVILLGYSTGGAHVMSFLEQSSLAEAVRGVVLDSPNVILIETIRHGSRGLKLAPTPIPVTQLIAEFGLWLVDLRWKIDWEATNYVQRSEEILKMPTLVFHGTSDHRVPISISRQLEARCSGTVQLIETQAAGHVMSWNANPERYETELGRFLERI